LLRGGAYAPISYYAGSDATPLYLVPTAAEVMDWATGDLGAPSVGGSTPPTGVELDDDPEAIQRLLGFLHPHGCAPVDEAFSPPHRQQSHAPASAVHRTSAWG
jgi:hypothetical protein